MPYKDKNKLSEYQRSYYTKNRKELSAGKKRAVYKHRRKLKYKDPAVVNPFPNTKNELYRENKNEPFVVNPCNSVVNPAAVLGKQDVVNPLTSRGLDKKSILESLRSKTSRILNTEFPRDGEPIESPKPKAEDDQMTVEPFYG